MVFMHTGYLSFSEANSKSADAISIARMVVGIFIIVRARVTI